MIETDPANLQPKLRPLNRRAAEFIGANAPPEIDSTRITQSLDVLESPWPLREEMMLREWFEDETRAGTAKSAYLIDKFLKPDWSRSVSRRRSRQSALMKSNLSVGWRSHRKARRTGQNSVSILTNTARPEKICALGESLKTAQNRPKFQ